MRTDATSFIAGQSLTPGHLQRLGIASRQILCLLGLMLLAACGKGLSGTYEMDSGMGTTGFVFKSGSKVIQTTDIAGMRSEAELTYKMDGDKLSLSNGQGMSMVLTVLPDGSLQGSMGMKYLKRK